MICPNCGKQIEDNNNFCLYCGINLKEKNKEVKQSKKQINFKLIVLIILSILIIGMLIIFIMYKLNGNNLSWNENYTDYKLKYITQSKVKLGINLSNDESLKNIKLDATCGDALINGSEIEWDLTDATGKCLLTVANKSKKISKEYYVSPYDLEKEELALEEKFDLDSDEDLDFDNLTNKEEKNYNTNPLLADSDMDGLDDDYELLTSKTDPNKKDTDGDGLNDYDEIELGLNPLKADSKDDGIKDSERNLTYNYENEGVKLLIKGKGNIASTSIVINDSTKISNKVGLINKLYSFYTEGKMNSAKVIINYSMDDIINNNLSEDNLTIYYYNEEDSTYEEVKTIVDKENKTLTADLTHFSNYVVGDKTKLANKTSAQILFVIDNSWSMYSNEQYKKITGEDYSSGLLVGDLDASDQKGLRFTLTDDLISKLSAKGYTFGLSEFRRDYKNALKIGSDTDSLKSYLKKMNGTFITKQAGTNISDALKSGIKEFSQNDSNKYIVILTDGNDSYLSSQVKSIIETANKNAVKICSIGFGSGANNTNLANISNGSGCKFFSSSDVGGLTELFDSLTTELNDDLVDIDSDGKNDAILIADSGFVVNRDGFSFPNYGSNLSPGGHCFGMATFAELYYKKVMPLKANAITADEDKAYAFDLTNTYFKNFSSLYNYKLKTNALQYAFGFDTFGEIAPANFYEVKDNVLAIKETYKKEIVNSGIYDISLVKTGISKEEQLKNYGGNYENAEDLLLNEDEMQNSPIVSKEDLQLFNAIYSSFIRQNITTFYSSSVSFSLWLANLVGIVSNENIKGDGFINILKSRLSDKDPLVISSSFNNGLHGINAISLSQDIINPNLYYIGVYDNNYPGEKRYVNMECKKNKCVTKANKYYKNSKQPIRITPSLEYDLEYYK